MKNRLTVEFDTAAAQIIACVSEKSLATVAEAKRRQERLLSCGFSEDEAAQYAGGFIDGARWSAEPK